MRKVITGAVCVFIFFFLKDYFQYSGFSMIFVLGYYASIIYLIVAIVTLLRAPSEVNRVSASEERKSSGFNPGCLGFAGLIVIAAFVYFMKEALGRYSYGTFVFIDRLVKVTDSLPPFIAWGILGLLVGSLYGSIVAWKKYHLNFSINLIPLGVLILIVGGLVVINHPSADSAEGGTDPGYEERMDKDSSLSAKQLIARRWKIVDVKGKNRKNFLKKNKDKKASLDFKENGKCYLSENDVIIDFFYYAVADDGKSFTFTAPKKGSEAKLINIISLSKDELVIKSEIFQNDTGILRPDE